MLPFNVHDDEILVVGAVDHLLDAVLVDIVHYDLIGMGGKIKAPQNRSIVIQQIIPLENLVAAVPVNIAKKDIVTAAVQRRLLPEEVELRVVGGDGLAITVFAVAVALDKDAGAPVGHFLKADDVIRLRLERDFPKVSPFAASNRLRRSLRMHTPIILPSPYRSQNAVIAAPEWEL